MRCVELSEGLGQLRNEIGIEGQLISCPGVEMIDTLPGEVQVAHDHLQFLQRQWIAGRNGRNHPILQGLDETSQCIGRDVSHQITSLNISCSRTLAIAASAFSTTIKAS